jgi:hypothetical protein
MARVTHVKSAQQRYKTVPVIDPATGEQKTTPVLRKDGTPKTTKRGREVVRRITTNDKTQPLPNRHCGKCNKEIEVGMGYKWIAPKSGPYGGRKMYRCEACPTWMVWEYSSSFSARMAQIEHEADITGPWESEDDARQAASDVAEQIRELAQEKEQGADNIEEGFGHSTYISDEMRDQAQQLEDWADEVEQSVDDATSFPEVEEVDCEQCGGSGILVNEEAEEGEEDEECGDCEGTGSVTPDEPTEEQIEEWSSEVADAISNALSNCPI